MSNLTIVPVTVDNWREAVFEEAKQKGNSLAKIAQKIGYARVSLSLAINDKYVGKTDKIRDAYIAYRKQVLCPYVGDTVSRQYCMDHANGDAPTHHPAKLRHWQACQRCIYCPKNSSQKEGKS